MSVSCGWGFVSTMVKYNNNNSNSNRNYHIDARAEHTAMRFQKGRNFLLHTRLLWRIHGSWCWRRQFTARNIVTVSTAGVNNRSAFYENLHLHWPQVVGERKKKKNNQREMDRIRRIKTMPIHFPLSVLYVSTWIRSAAD